MHDFMEKLIRFSSLFGIVPWYNSQQRKLVYKRTFQWYSSILVILMVCFFLTVFYARRDIHYADTTVLAFLDFATDLVGICKFTVIAFGAAFWNMKSWEKFVAQLFYIKKNVGSTSKNFIAKHEKIIFFFGNLFIIILYVSEFVIYSSNLDFCFYYAFTCITIYVGYVTAYLMINIVVTINRGYKRVNDRLVQTLYCQWKLHDDWMETMKRTKKFLLVLEETVNNFNKVLGWGLLLTLFEQSIQILTCLIYASEKRFYQNSLERPNGIANICFIQNSMIWLMAIVFCCDSVVRETDELLTNCYRLEQTLPLMSKELEELESLKTLIKNKRPKLTAAGFFEIKRSTLLSLLSTTTTYFIVALQFNSL